jgi:hypothetical protein
MIKISARFYFGRSLKNFKVNHPRGIHGQNDQKGSSLFVDPFSWSLSMDPEIMDPKSQKSG